MRRRRRPARQRGAAAILAMMFLMIFGSLAAAMAIVAQANLTTADSHLKVNRARAATETGMQYLLYRINNIIATVQTRDGLIDDSNANELWAQTRDALLLDLASELHNIEEPYVLGESPYPDSAGLHIGPIALGPNDPSFTATLTPHPLAGEDYSSSYYQRAPYSSMSPAVSSVNPLDGTWIRLRLEAADGPTNHTQITRAIQVDLKMDKKIRFAILSKSRVMIGSHVMIEGPIGSRFTETHLTNGHPIQLMSDFGNLTADLDDSLEAFVVTLNSFDMDGDNRIQLSNPAEADAYEDPEDLDFNGDGYIDEMDLFLGEFDDNADGIVSSLELGVSGSVLRQELMTLIDTFGDSDRAGFGDGQIDADDYYAKIRGEIMLTADFAGWNDGAADGSIQDFYQGPIHPSYDSDPLTFSAGNADVHSFESTDFDTSAFKTLASGDLATQAAAQVAEAAGEPGDPVIGTPVTEEVPYGAAHPYDYYDRPVYQNMTFTNITIPKGSNALFVNCTFIGVTFVETETSNTDPNFNYAGMVEADGTLKHPDRVADVDAVGIADTKTISNNLRFDSCTFEGGIVSDAPPAYTHVRNKIAFTGGTEFVLEDSDNLTDAEKLMFKRSTILTPHYSVEMGTFIDPTDAGEFVELSGTIVAGLIDMRGNVRITGTVLTTFEPISNTGPVIGETSPQFNTTLGYFSSTDGDLEAELPASGLGVIQVRYDDTIPLPDGILGPIELQPVMATYFERGAS